MTTSELESINWAIGQLVGRLDKAGIVLDGVIIQGMVEETGECVTHVWADSQAFRDALIVAMDQATGLLSAEMDREEEEYLSGPDSPYLEGPWKPTADNEPA